MAAGSPWARRINRRSGRVGAADAIGYDSPDTRAHAGADSRHSINRSRSAPAGSWTSAPCPNTARVAGGTRPSPLPALLGPSRGIGVHHPQPGELGVGDDRVRDGYLRARSRGLRLRARSTSSQPSSRPAALAGGGGPRRRPAEHREASPRRPAGAVGPHDRAADLLRAGGGVAGGGEPGAWPDRSADSARRLMPLSIRRSIAKSPISIRMKLKNARPGVSHR
jgi:hypothetical protein